MADILLAHSYHLAYDPKQLRKMQPYPPLGTLYAATALREHGISVAVFDSMLQDPTSAFPEILRRQQPKVLAIYEDDFNFLSKMCLTRMRELAWQLARAARDAGAIVIVHGSDATDHAKAYLDHGADFVLVGEAEQSLVELCASILKGAPSSIPGLHPSGCRRRSCAEPGQVSAQRKLEEPAEAGTLLGRSCAIPAGMALSSRSVLYQRGRQPRMPIPL